MVKILHQLWDPELELKVINGTNDIRHLDFNRFLYFGVPSAEEIYQGNVISAKREKQIIELKYRVEESLLSGSISSSTLVNYYVEIRKYLRFCDEKNMYFFTKNAIDEYCNYQYQRVLRNEIKRTAYSTQCSKLNKGLSIIDIPQSWFHDIAVVSRDCVEPYESYSQHDLKKMLPLLRALFKQTSTQFLQSPKLHCETYKTKPTMIFHWQGKDYPLCGAVNKMMSAATFLLAYYTYTNSTQLYLLKRPTRARFSVKDVWYSMSVFKRRSFKVIHVEMGDHSLDIPKYSICFFDKLLEVSECIDPSENTFLLHAIRNGVFKPMSGRILTDFNNIFFRDYFPLKDSQGRELRPQISRFRETGSQLTEYYQGEVATGVVLGNTLNTRRKHYSTGNKIENQKMTQETAMIREDQAKNRSSAKEARQNLDIKMLTIEEYNNKLMPGLSASAHGSHCGAPFGEQSEKYSRKVAQHHLSIGEKLACADLLKCFGCENQVIVQSVDDIWCLLSFMECIEESLYLHINKQHYKKNFEDIIIFVNEKILTKIKHEVKIKAQKKLNQTGRHPLWKDVESSLYLIKG